MTDHYPATEFSSIDELCGLITETTEGWDTCWFRGCTSPQHRLLPSLFREEGLPEREGYIAVEFRRRAYSRLKGMTSQFDWLCAMQHFGLPTRLLDWSESLSVSLYFSIGDIDWRSARPTIWVLNPFALAAIASHPNTIPIATSETVEANADIAFCDDEDRLMDKRSVTPLPVAPNFLFDRLAAQNGTFTIHGTDPRPVDEIVRDVDPDALRKFVVREDRALEIVNCIRLLRPSPDAIFPDIDGMKNYLV